MGKLLIFPTVNTIARAVVTVRHRVETRNRWQERWLKDNNIPVVTPWKWPRGTWFQLRRERIKILTERGMY